MAINRAKNHEEAVQQQSNMPRKTNCVRAKRKLPRICAEKKLVRLTAQGHLNSRTHRKRSNIECFRFDSIRFDFLPNKQVTQKQNCPFHSFFLGIFD